MALALWFGCTGIPSAWRWNVCWSLISFRSHFIGVGSIAERFVIVFTLSDLGSRLKVFFFLCRYYRSLLVLDEIIIL